MKRIYAKPAVQVVDVKIEKGFAASQDTFGIENFQYEGGEGDENSAW